MSGAPSPITDGVVIVAMTATIWLSHEYVFEFVVSTAVPLPHAVSARLAIVISVFIPIV